MGLTKLTTVTAALALIAASMVAMAPAVQADGRQWGSCQLTNSRGQVEETAPTAAECVGVTSLDALRGKTSLTRVNIQDSSVTDFSVLATLDNVSSLIYSNSEPDERLLSVLQDMQSLRTVNAGGPFESLSQVKGAHNLRQLFLEVDKSSDLTPLAAMSNLETLAVYFQMNLPAINLNIGEEATFPTFIGLDGKPIDWSLWSEARHVKKVAPNTIRAVSGGQLTVLDGAEQLTIPKTMSKLNVAEVQIVATPVVTVKEPVSYADSYSWRFSTENPTAGSTVWIFPSTNGTAHSYNVQWLRNGKVIPGATRTSYKFTVADAGQKIQVRLQLSASPGAGWITPIYRTYTVPKTAKHKYTSIARPKISGTPNVGSTLTASKPVTKPSSTKVTYQWLRSGKAIKGAAKQKYVLTSSDRGKKITVKATVSRSGYLTREKTSSQTKAIGYGKFRVTRYPVVTGKVRTGATLKASKGTWVGSPSKYTYRWYRNGVPISKATKPTYKVTARDVGRVISVKVSGTKPGYTKKTVSSRVR